MAIAADRKLLVACIFLAIGQFALVTSVWMLTGVLEPLARDFGTSIGTAGQVLSVFSITYALSAPFLSVAAARTDPRKLLIAMLAVFAAANIYASLTTSFELLLASRVVAAAADGLYAATATAVVSAMAPPHLRGRMLAALNSGVTLSLFLGVPLSTIIGQELGWRATFYCVAALAMTASLGLIFFMPRVAPPPASDLADRLRLLRTPEVLPTLLVVMLSYLGMYTVYAYLAPILTGLAGVSSGAIGFMLMVFGISAVVGNWVGGFLADRWGADRALRASIFLAVPMLAILPLLARSPGMAAVMLFLWGGVHYAGLSPVHLRMAQLAAPHTGLAIALTNASVYVGVALGATIGGVLVDSRLPLTGLGFAGAAFKASALFLLLYLHWHRRRGREERER